MSFVDRVKKILLERNRKELESVQKSIDELTERHAEEFEGVQILKEASDVANREKSKVQNTMLSKKELEDLKIIYDFVSNYQKIENVVERIKSMQLPRIDNEFVIYMNGNNSIDAEMTRRYELYDAVKKLNSEITEIINLDEPNIEKGEEVSTVEKKVFLLEYLERKKRLKEQRIH